MTDDHSRPLDFERPPEPGSHFFEIDLDAYDETDPIYEPEEELDAAQALMRCLDERGVVDITRIAELASMPVKEAAERLSGAIIRDPEGWSGRFSEGFVLRDSYLSGNLSAKLRTAKDANKKYNGLFEENVRAITAVMPTIGNTQKLHVSLGAPWVPPYVIDDFVSFLLHVGTICSGGTEYDRLACKWSVPSAEYLKYNPYNTTTYGTPSLTALNILERTLNSRPIRVYHQEYGTSVLNVEETELAMAKQKLIMDKFEDWVFADPRRKAALHRAYDTVFGKLTGRCYDGSFLTLPGMNPEVTLRRNQKDAVARILFTSNVLLAHDVGAGKTYTMIAGGHELRRMKLSEKLMYVVPNAVFPQWVSDFRYLYPDMKVLTIDRRNFGAKQRQHTLELARDGGYDAILITASSFARLPLSIDRRINSLLDHKAEINLAAAGRTKYRYRVDTMLRRIDREVADLRKKQDEMRAAGLTEGICFNDLGITTLFVDEAHEYKNITIRTRFGSGRDSMQKGSVKCDEMLEKVRYTQEHGRGAVFATATPISNSIADVYTMQYFLQYGEMQLYDIASFDNWANTFARREAALELDVDGRTFRNTFRLTSFYNLRELSALFTQTADFFVEDTANRSCCTTHNVQVPCSPELKDFITSLSDRAEKVRSGLVARRDDNLLKITVDGRMAALDLRILAGGSCDPDTTKTFACARQVFEIWQHTAPQRLTQVVFCDLSTPKNGFNVYDDLRSRLVSLGVPAGEIAFIHDATSDKEKARLFRLVNDGTVRVLVGSTPKLGTGVNVQRLLCAVHHLDVPWRPSDVTQRDGRMLRQGNECVHTDVYRYVTEGSFDAFSWQILERKQTFIAQFMTNTLSDESDCSFDELALSFAEIKSLAVGDPLVRDLIRARTDLSHTMALQRAYVTQHVRIEQELAELPERIRKQQGHVDDLIADAKTCEEAPDFEDDKDERRQLGEELLEALSNNVMMPHERRFDSFRGLDIMLPANMTEENPCVILSGRSRCIIPMGENAGGNVRRIDNAVSSIPARLSDAETLLADMISRKSRLEDEHRRRNPYEGEITRLNKLILDISVILDERSVPKH